MRRIISGLTNRLTIIGILLLLQVLLLAWFILAFTSDWYYLHITSMIFGFIISLYIIAGDTNPSFKLIWVTFILITPVFGILLFFYSRSERLNRIVLARMLKYQKKREDILKDNESINSEKHLKQQTFLNNAHFPTFINTESIFLASGTIKQNHLLTEIKKAKHFIFMEYFIITKSKMWDEIVELLIAKQKEGVEVKIIYDDFGSATKLPFYHHRYLKKKGIEVVRFNPMRIRFNFAMNYRDHRKIVVIDNKVAFTGGFNIGDEYTNKKQVFGYWNDAGIMIKGDAVWTHTLLFLENWMFSTKKEVDIYKYKLNHNIKNDKQYIPFGDIPASKNLLAKSTYLHLINDAKTRVLITAPYLILDNEILTSLKLAAKSGVDVNIIVPNIPDKKAVYMVSETYIYELIKERVKIHKFIPGFIHSKMIIADDEVAMIGTSNLDFRSLYMHLENNVWLNDKKTIDKMVKYYEDTLEYSKLIKADEIKKRNIFYRILQGVLKGFSPLL